MNAMAPMAHMSSDRSIAAGSAVLGMSQDLTKAAHGARWAHAASTNATGRIAITEIRQVSGRRQTYVISSNIGATSSL